MWYGMVIRLLVVLVGLACCYVEISDDSLHHIPSPGKDFDVDNGALLAPILIPRVPGTPGNAKVRQHIVDFFRNELPEWRVELQNSTSKTPATGDKLIPFVNIIATRDPPNSRAGEVGRLALVAHYDSLITPEGFIGATDSAASCAMLMHAARSLDKALTRKWTADKAADFDGLDDTANKGLQIIFTDGEEAFLHWTDTDSIYGARSLAEDWESRIHPAASTYQNELRSIDLFVLLDLLGAHEDAIIPSWFLTTHWAYRNMANLEDRLRKQGLFKSSPNHASRRAPSDAQAKEPTWLPDAKKVEKEFRPSPMGDDHTPFMDRGVEVLHLIPSNFPLVWHNMRGVPDDAQALDLDKCEDWTTLVIAFAASYMELDGFLGPRSSNSKRDQVGKSELINRMDLQAMADYLGLIYAAAALGAFILTTHTTRAFSSQSIRRSLNAPSKKARRSKYTPPNSHKTKLSSRKGPSPTNKLSLKKDAKQEVRQKAKKLPRSAASQSTKRIIKTDKSIRSPSLKMRLRTPGERRRPVRLEGYITPTVKRPRKRVLDETYRDSLQPPKSPVEDPPLPRAAKRSRPSGNHPDAIFKPRREATPMYLQEEFKYVPKKRRKSAAQTPE